MDSAETVIAGFEPLYPAIQDGVEDIGSVRPLLAHYTSVEVLEAIVKTSQIWLSNPLFMNDLEEMRFGMHIGEQVFLESDKVDEAVGSSERGDKLRAAYAHYTQQFADSEALDT